MWNGMGEWFFGDGGGASDVWIGMGGENVDGVREIEPVERVYSCGVIIEGSCKYQVQPRFFGLGLSQPTHQSS